MEATLFLYSNPTHRARALAAADDERDALGSLYSTHSERWFGLALWTTGDREEAADAVHDAVIKMWRHRDKLAAARSPEAYALRVVRSAAIDRLRRRRPTEEVDVLVLPVEGDAEARAEAGRISKHLARLPEAQRAVVYLRHFADLRFREIGRVLEISTFTAASRHRLAMAKLRKWVGA